MSWCQPCGCPGKPHEWVRRPQLRQPCFSYCCSETGPDLDCAEHSMSKAPSGKVKTMTCSCHLGYSKLNIWMSEQQLHVCFFSFQQVQGSCWDTTQVHFKRIQVMHNSLHYINCIDLKKKSGNFQQQKYTHQTLPPQILTAKDQWFKQ